MAVKSNYDDGKVVKGTAKADTIENSGNSVTISVGAGNDYIENYESNVLISYSGGNDFIEGFMDNSTLKIASGTMNSVITTNGSELFLTVGKNVVTLTGKAGFDKVNIVNSKGKAVKFSIKPDFKFTKGKDSVTNYLSNITLSALASNDPIENYGDNVTINAGAGNDSIYNSWGDSVSIAGGAGNDKISLDNSDAVTINGGKGNDSLWGSYGDETFIYASGDGKDVIFGFDEDDLLQITGTFSTSLNKAKTEIYFKVGSTAKAITLKDFSATTFNVNGDSYEVSGTKLVKK